MNGFRQSQVRPERGRQVAGTLVLYLMLAAGFCGCGRAAPADDAGGVVYICSETHELVVGPPESVPALNPKTSRRTLLRGGYCAHCRRWYALPPPDHAAGNPRAMYCRQHNVMMSFQGPVEQLEPRVVEGSAR